MSLAVFIEIHHHGALRAGSHGDDVPVEGGATQEGAVSP